MTAFQYNVPAFILTLAKVNVAQVCYKIPFNYRKAIKVKPTSESRSRKWWYNKLSSPTFLHSVFQENKREYL